MTFSLVFDLWYPGNAAMTSSGDPSPVGYHPLPSGKDSKQAAAGHRVPSLAAALGRRKFFFDPLRTRPMRQSTHAPAFVLTETHARRYVGTRHIESPVTVSGDTAVVSGGPKLETHLLTSAYFPPVPAVRIARTQPALLTPATSSTSTFTQTKTKTDSNIGRRRKERFRSSRLTEKEAKTCSSSCDRVLADKGERRRTKANEDEAFEEKKKRARNPTPLRGPGYEEALNVAEGEGSASHT
ncbi:hypothetical protein WN51_06395 [Melipona quadrifasciata]|uniref:Uncharacterized protein n=1 Tax=Melipona quadrifasciata TaxID=166423 RepID=A0A0M9ABP3_9HYME|nr:hypothetical protein WN51_06395 [Melipona quadrifasciata]